MQNRSYRTGVPEANVPGFLARYGNIMCNSRNSWRTARHMITDVWRMCYDAKLLMWLSAVKLLGRYQGRNGQIEIVECSWDGTRVYFEEGVRQSQATPDGESVFTYVKLMDELLSRSEQILVLGCGGGNLATRLPRLGKTLGSRPALDRLMRHSHERWAIRRGRLRSRDLPFGSR